MKFLPIHICSAMVLAAFAAQAETRISATGAQAELCDVDGIKTLHSGTGYTVESFASRNTTPSIVVSLNGKQCYFDLVAGEGSGFNVKYNGQTYHTRRPGYIPTFFFKPATDATTYSFRISAAGQFDIDWGDGTIQMIDKTDTADTVYTHNYARAANTYDISLGGRATAYSTDATTAAISFNDYVYTEADSAPQPNNEHAISSMRGCLGCVFSTVSDKIQPSFAQAFAGNTELSSSIPAELFNGVTGAPVKYMFDSLFRFDSSVSGAIPSGLFSGLSGAPAAGIFRWSFQNCSNLTGDIPEDLFAKISGAPASEMFRGTFLNCTNISGDIPSGLFRGISGAPAWAMYLSTFRNCSNLTGQIPDRLFGNIKGAPASQMFYMTFLGTGISGEIPENLFEGITTTGTWQSSMFERTFEHCPGLTGKSARIGGRYLYEIWSPSNALTYTNDKKLTDYDCIPTTWGGGGTKSPGECEE